MAGLAGGIEDIAGRAVEPACIAGHAGELDGLDPGDDGGDLAGRMPIVQPGLEGAHQMVGGVAQGAKIDDMGGLRQARCELRGQRLGICQPFAEDEGIADEEVGRPGLP